MALATILCSTSCSIGVDVPDELKDESSSSVIDSSIVEDSLTTESTSDFSSLPDNTSDLEMITLVKLKENKLVEIEKVYNAEYDNFTFNNEIDFVVPAEIGMYKLKAIDGFTNRSDEIFSKYVPAEIFDKSKITINEQYYPVGPTYEDTENNIYIDVCEGGYFNYYPVGNADNPYIETTDEESYPLITGKLDKQVTINAKEVTVTELWNKTSSFLEELNAVSECEINFIPFVAVLGKSAKDGKDTVCFTFRSTVNGLPLNSFTQTSTIGSEKNPDLYSKHPGRCQYYNIDEFNYLTLEGCTQVEKVFESYDSIITPSCATKLLSNKLSGYSQYEVLGMELAYSKLNSSESKNIVEPYWFVYFDLEPEKEIFGMVNAITGEITFVNNK